MDGRPKERFYTLDAIRGMAAIAVFMGHASSFFGPFGAHNSGLAVDLFFALSGFVLTESYGLELMMPGAMGAFIKKRVIRLYPLYLIGLILSIASSGLALLAAKGAFSVCGFFIAVSTALLMLPSPTWHEAPQIMPLNSPAWSLFFEIVVNVLFAFIYRKLNSNVLLTIIISSLICLALLSQFTGEFIGGFYWSNFADGIPRVCFSFFLGVAVYRYRPAYRFRSPWAWLIIAALIPVLYVTRASVWSDLFLVAMVLPAMVVLGTIIQPKYTEICKFMGDISYPLYAIHVPIIFIIYRILNKFHRNFEWMSPVSGFCLLILLIFISYLLNKYFDAPVRDWIRRMSIKSKPTNIGPGTDIIV